LFHRRPLPSIDPDEPLADFIGESDTINKLRLLLVWAFPTQLLTGQTPAARRGEDGDGSIDRKGMITLRGHQPTDKQLVELLKGVCPLPERRWFSKTTYSVTVQGDGATVGALDVQGAAECLDHDDIADLPVRFALCVNETTGVVAGFLVVQEPGDVVLEMLGRLVTAGRLSCPEDDAVHSLNLFVVEGCSTAAQVSGIRQSLRKVAEKATGSAWVDAATLPDKRNAQTFEVRCVQSFT
jgi:hypothetical protein